MVCQLYKIGHCKGQFLRAKFYHPSRCSQIKYALKRKRKCVKKKKLDRDKCLSRKKILANLQINLGFHFNHKKRKSWLT